MVCEGRWVVVILWGSAAKIFITLFRVIQDYHPGEDVKNLWLKPQGITAALRFLHSKKLPLKPSRHTGHRIA